MDVEFHKQGSIGILFEAVSEYAPITIGQVKPASQASERSELVRGLALLRVQGQSIQSLKFEQALQLLSNQQRPLKLTFSREPIPSPPASPSPSIPEKPDVLAPAADTPKPTMRTTREDETPYTREQRDWQDAVRAFNSDSKKGVKYMVEVGLVPNTPKGVATMLRDGPDRRGLSKQQIGEYLSGGKPEEQAFRQAVRTAYLEFADYRGWSFVTALRSFLQGFRLPGESMLIERIIFSFAVRFYEQNPGYCVHLTDEKIGVLQEMFMETSGGELGIGIHLVNSLFKSIGSDFKFMKDAEVYDMMEVTPTELAHTRELLEADPQQAEELHRTAETLRRATALMKLETEAQVAQSQADAASSAAEQTAVLAAQAHDDERMQLGRDAADRGLEAEYAATKARSAQEAAVGATEHFEKLSPGFRIELPMFLAMVARKLGTDTMFVLAYSVIMLNTDAHNPRLQKTERISKAQFIENNKRSPDLAAISEVIMASLYDEIVSQEIKLKDEEESTSGDSSAAGGASPTGYLRRMSFIGGGDEQTPPRPEFNPADVGQQLYAVQQVGLKGLPRKVKIGLTGMGISVFDVKGRPLTNLLYQTMVKWGVDVSQSQKVLGLRVLTDEAEIFFKTPEGEALCAKLSSHSLAVKKAARQREKAETERLRVSQNNLSLASLRLDESDEMDETDASTPEMPLSPPADASTAPEVPADAAAPAAAAPAASAPMSLLSLHSGVHSEMDASLRAATLSAQRLYVAVAASTAGVDGAEVPRCGREAYIALHRVYNLQLPDVTLTAEPESPVVQIPLPPMIVAAQFPPPEPEPALAEPQPASLIESDGEDAADDGNGTATSGTDSEEDLVPAGAEEQSWEKAAMKLKAEPAPLMGDGSNEETAATSSSTTTTGDAAEGDDGEPQLASFYSDAMPNTPMDSYYAKSPRVIGSPRALAAVGSSCAAAVEADFGSTVRRRVQLTRAFTQLRDELGDDGALEVVSEVYDEMSPPRHADSRGQQQEEEQGGEQQRTRTLTTPDQPPYEESNDGKEILF